MSKIKKIKSSLVFICIIFLLILLICPTTLADIPAVDYEGFTRIDGNLTGAGANVTVRVNGSVVAWDLTGSSSAYLLHINRAYNGSTGIFRVNNIFANQSTIGDQQYFDSNTGRFRLDLNASNDIPNITLLTPTNGSTAVNVTANLTWNGTDSNPGDELTYDVYFSTSNPPTTKVSNNQTSTTYNPPGSLTLGTTYYWKIVAWDQAGGSNTSEIWHFLVNRAPNASTLVSPTPSGVTGQAISVTLQWNCSDPDGDNLTYNVYFDTSDPPTTKISNNQTGKTCSSPGLGYSTWYYWKIVAWDNHSASTGGPVWQFRTVAASPGGGGTPSGDTTPPSTPTNVRCTTPVTDNTPSFSWNASTDSGGIAGYYVKIDSGTDTWVGNVLTWTSTNAIADGTHTFYVKAKDASSNIGSYGSCSFTINTTTVVNKPVANAKGPYTGLVFQNITTFDGSGSTDNGTITNYTWDFGDGTTGYGVKPIHSYNRSGLFNITLTVKDDDNLTDSDTTTATIIIDSDGDGLSDEIEERLGSDPHNASDVKQISIEGVIYYLVDINGDGQPDKLYIPPTDTNTTITITDGKYYLDINNDGEWEYIYDPATGIVTPYTPEEKPTGGLLPSWLITLFIILGVAGAIILLIIAILFKTGYLSIEAESAEKPEEEPAEKPTPPKKK